MEEEDEEATGRRTWSEIRKAEKELGDLFWYQKAEVAIRARATMGELDEAKELRDSFGLKCREIEEHHGGLEDIRVDDDFELGMLMGKVSALRWVLGVYWDAFDY